MSDMRRGDGRMVRAEHTHCERQAGCHSRAAQGCSWQVRRHRLAYVPPHLPVVAGRDRSADEGPTGTHASRLHPNHDERVWTGDAGVEERSQWKSRHDGAQALAGERLKYRFFLLGVNGSESFFLILSKPLI